MTEIEIPEGFSFSKDENGRIVLTVKDGAIFDLKGDLRGNLKGDHFGNHEGDHAKQTKNYNAGVGDECCCETDKPLDVRHDDDDTA